MYFENIAPLQLEGAEGKPLPLLITAAKVAAMLGVREGTVRKWIARAYIYSVKLGRARRIPMSEVARLVLEGMPVKAQLDDASSSLGIGEAYATVSK